MLKSLSFTWLGCLWWVGGFAHLALVHRTNFSHDMPGKPLCHPGYYCPMETLPLVPCPKGTYGPTTGAVSVDSCLSCPPHHYCPRPGLPAALPCGPGARQPLSGQDRCICLGEGKSFQRTDGRCTCALEYQVTSDEQVCVERLYDVCRDGQTRTQYGNCLDRRQWAQHCGQQVCRSAEDYQGYDAELGLCACREAPGGATCGGLCRRGNRAALMLLCSVGGDPRLVWTSEGQASAFSGSLFERTLKRWDSQGNLLCGGPLSSSRSVYAVETMAAGFLGLLHGLPNALHALFQVPAKDDPQNSAGFSQKDNDSSLNADAAWAEPPGENVNDGAAASNSTSGLREGGPSFDEPGGVTGVMNPTACLRLGDILLFTVDQQHYPQYDPDNLFNTNGDFDWGVFRQLAADLSLSPTPPGPFSVVFSQPGVYVLKLSSDRYKHMYVRVMPAGGQCYDTEPFLPSTPRHVNRVGIKRRHTPLLRPDWATAGGLLFGAVVILCLCVTLLILFREYGWPEKQPIKARYRALQLCYNMDDFSSKGSRVTSFKRTHRNLQGRMTQDSIGPAEEEFWDYEQQVDLEAFSTNTFYGLLLKQSLSVTSQLGQLTTEVLVMVLVKELYRGVQGKIQLLHPRWPAEERMDEGRMVEGCAGLRRAVEREAGRRRSLASQLHVLLDRQIQVLQRERQAQTRVNNVFAIHFRECARLLAKADDTHLPFWEQHQPNLGQRILSLAMEMERLVTAECRRQGAWGMLGEGTGARLLCPDTGAVLTKEHIIGLMRPDAQCHMLLSSGHTVPVPPDFFLHPQTGRAMPIQGNVAYDPVSSTLVCTTDLSAEDTRKCESPLLPFLLYPTSRHSNQPLPCTKLRGLRPGQQLQLGSPMADPVTGVPVPILAVTIHPQTGLVYPLGGVHVCPITSLHQPIQVGSPVLDPRTGSVVLSTGVSLDHATGSVVPVGGVVLAEPFIEPLSGKLGRVGGVGVRAGQLVPHAGGHQAFLDTKVLSARVRVVELLKGLTEERGSNSGLQPRQGGERGSGHGRRLQAAATELQQAWRRSLHCQVQLLTRLGVPLDWADHLQEDGGSMGQMHLPGSETCVPALLGMDYPDPTGSGLSVPVLGSQTDPVTGLKVPLAGTMEDPEGKGLVAIRYGSLTVDPVTRMLAPVVGARLDVSKKNIIPVTASYWLTATDCTDSVQMETLQREVCLRNSHWQGQSQKEDTFLSDLDLALLRFLSVAAQADSDQQVPWSESGQSLRELGVELQSSAESEAQRRAAQSFHLSTLLPPHVTHILTQGDHDEWELQCLWQSELMSGLDSIEVCIERLQHDQEKWTSQEELRASDLQLRQRELSQQFCSRQAELETALTNLRSLRLLSQIGADTAQAVLSGKFWYKDYGVSQHNGPRNVGLVQQKALPLLERLSQLLEDKQPASISPSTCHHQLSGFLTKQTYGLEMCSRVWTASVPVANGISTQSLKEPFKAQSRDSALQASLQLTDNYPGSCPASSGVPCGEHQLQRACVQPALTCVPTISEQEWAKLLELSPLFQLLRKVELQLKERAMGTGLLREELSAKFSGNSFVDVLDAQWECEGELVLLDPAVLSAREFLVYQHGLFLSETLHELGLTAAVSLRIAAGLPRNNYINNAFRNSFFYQEAEDALCVRRQRLQSVGGFSLLLLHCLSHISLGEIGPDSSPAFQRLFFKSLQAALGELFQARLGAPSSAPAAEPGAGAPNRGGPQGHSHEALPGFHVSVLLDKLHRPSGGVLSRDAVAGLQKRHSETSLFTRVEELLREKSGSEPETQS